jgi:hypothetical protein
MLASYMAETGRSVAILPRQTLKLMRHVEIGDSAIGNWWQLFLAKRAGQVFLCLNDAFGPSPRDTAVEVVRGFLDDSFPQPSAFEAAGKS